MQKKIQTECTRWPFVWNTWASWKCQGISQLSWRCHRRMSGLVGWLSTNTAISKRVSQKILSRTPLLHFAWGIAEAKCTCILATAVCVYVTREMVGVPSSCALLGGFAIGAQVSLLWQHTYVNLWPYTLQMHIARNAKCQRVLVLALWLVSNVCGCTSVSRLSLVFKLLFLLSYREHLVKYALTFIVSW